MNDPIYETYRRLLETVTDESGYGGPVAHVAEAEGWQLRISTSDFGDLAVSARKDGGWIAFEYAGDERSPAWTPLTTGTRPEDLPWLTALVSGVDEWHDTITRPGATASLEMDR